MIISQKAQGISPSPTLAVDAKAKQMKKEGHNIIGFGAGEPDFDTPEFIKTAAVSAINSGFTKYTPVGGIEELKSAVSNYFKDEIGVSYATDQILVSNGAKHSVYNALYCLLNPGDEVLIPAPYWVSYPEMVRLCEGVPIFVPTSENNNFILNSEILEKYITDKTKVLIINSPNNPCGNIYPEENIKQIAEIAAKHNIFVISDEIYDKLIYDGLKHTSIAAVKDMADRTIVINGVSKTFAMTGWRIGFAAGPKQLIKAMENFQSHATSNPNSIAQKASVEALTNPLRHETIAKMVKEFSDRRIYMVNKINQINNLSCNMPNGAFYVFVNISKTFGKECQGKIIQNSTDFSEVLLEKYEVAVVPGVAFGADEYIRLSYATSMENIKEGLDRLESFVNIIK